MLVACRVPKLGRMPWPGRLRGPLVFVEEAAEDGSAPDPRLGEIGDGMVGPGRAELAAAVGSASVVVGRVPGHHDAQVAFAEDQHPVGDGRSQWLWPRPPPQRKRDIWAEPVA
jgi:hypothetical protein